MRGGEGGLRTARRRIGVALAAAGLLLAIAGCTVPEPGGAGMIRYRDPVFSSITTTTGIQYATAPDLNGNPVDLTLDLYQPAGDTVAQRPAIVFVHGGGYFSGDAESQPAAGLAQMFARLGYVTVSINYRLLAPSSCSAGNGTISPQCYTAAVAAEEDAQAAVRWLRANATTYRADPTRIGIGGDSAGAITATAVGLDAPDTPDAGNAGYSDAVQGFMSLSGGLPDGEYASATAAPGLLFSGTADPIVPFAWSVQTAAALLDDGVAAWLEPFDGAGHDPYSEFESQIDTQSDYFFYDALDAADAQGSSAAARAAFHAQIARWSRREPALARTLRADRRRAMRLAGPR